MWPQPSHIGVFCVAIVATTGIQSIIMRSALIKIRATQTEKEAFERASSLAGLSLSAWVRERLRRTVIRELTEAGIQIAFLQVMEGQD